MIIGVNEQYQHEGKNYHIQIEDLDATRELDVRVYMGGGIVFHKRQPYAQILEGLPKGGRVEDALSEEVTRLLGVVKAAIAKGRIGSA